MKRVMYTVVISILSVAIGITFCVLKSWVQELQSYNHVWANCHSDVMIPFRMALDTYRANHAGRFPDVNEMREMLDGYTTPCRIFVRSEKKPQVLLRGDNTGTFAPDRHDEHLVCWCLSGEDGKYASLVTLGPNGTTRAQVVTLEELLEFLSKEFATCFMVPPPKEEKPNTTESTM